MASSYELEVECLLCKEIIKCQENDTSILVDHVKLKHPDIKISNLPPEFNIFPKSETKKPTKENKIVSSIVKDIIKGSGNTKKAGSSPQKIMEENNQVSDCDGNSIPKSTPNNEMKAETNIPPRQTTKRRKLYKTSVEKWRPGSDKIMCPKCNAIVRPIIRTSANRVTHSPFGAALIMTCWPFCFFPFLFPAPIEENLHCSICGYYFGSYNYEKQTMNVPKSTVPRKSESIDSSKKKENSDNNTN